MDKGAYAQQTDVFVRFIQEKGFTIDHVYQAYLQFVGGSEHASPDVAIDCIIEKMEEMATSEEGFPLNRFTSIMKIEGVFQNELERYHRYVNTLNISEKEKNILHSIVDKHRKGEVDCFIEGTLIESFKVGEVPVSEITLASELTQKLSRIKKQVRQGKQYEFRFTEK